MLRDESEGLRRGAGQVAQGRRPSRIQGGGIDGRGEPAEPRVRSGEVVIAGPALESGRAWASERNRVSFKSSSRRRPMKLSTKAVWTGLPGEM